MSRYNGQSYSGPRTTNQSPSDYGWTQTGANNQSRVEFYQRGNDRMDYYPSTGTVKTIIDHPTKGTNDLYRGGERMSAGDRARVFDNPRSHTSYGYRNNDFR